MASRGTGKSSQRLFVALDPPSRVCAEVAAWGREAAGRDRRMRPVPVANCHITLAFIGDSARSDAAGIGDAIEDSVRSVAGLSLGAPVWLPRRRPRALALEIHDSLGQLQALHSQLAAALSQAIGWKPQRHFRPHLTGVRLSRGFDPAAGTLPVSPALEFSGEAVTLYRSELLPEGARYEPLAGVQI